MQKRDDEWEKHDEWATRKQRWDNGKQRGWDQTAWRDDDEYGWRDAEEYGASSSGWQGRV